MLRNKKITTTKKKLEKVIKEQIEAQNEEQNYKKVSRTIILKELENILKEASDTYYNTGKPIISDEYFDELLDIFRLNSQDNTFLSEIGAPIRNEIIKETLPYWMGSMDKVKPNTKELTRWLDKNKPPYVISEKLDGVSALLTFNYEEQDSIMLFTRGNGKIGQNISYLIPQLNLNDDSILKKVKQSKISIRGELIMKKKVFEDIYSSTYPKSRSLISGTVNAKKPDPNIIRDMDFIGYEVIFDSKDNISIEHQLKLIKKLNMKCVNYKILKGLVNSEILTKGLLDMKTNSEYEIDGIIISNNKVNIKNKSGNPKYAVAFKIKLDDQMATTSVVDVEWNPSKHGTLIPRIKFKPIVIGGDTIKYTTGFNAKYIKDNCIGIGSKLNIIRSGDVIPYINEVISISKNKKALLPDKDKYGKWKWSDSNVDIILEDSSSSKEVKIKELTSFFTTLKISGVSEGIVSRLVENGFDTIKKICLMTVDCFLTLPGIKDKMANKLYTNIHNIIDKPISLSKLMTSTNIFKGGLGEKKIEIVISKYPNIMTKTKLTLNDIIGCVGFSQKTSNSFLIGFKKFVVFIKEHSFLKYNVKSSSIEINDKLKNEFIVITGFRDSILEEKIVFMGGKIQNNINSKTTLLIVKDINSTSSKIQKAQGLKIKIITLSNFKKEYK
mgnify:CR=1 FL=1